MDPGGGTAKNMPVPEDDVASKSRIADRLRATGLKATPQRILIFQELMSRKDHPTAEDLFSAVKKVHPTISFNTVYHTLQALTEKEMINVIRPVVDAARYDPITDVHGHFMCSQCKRIEDQLMEDPNLKQIDSEVKSSGRYWVVQSQILWVGLCETCGRESNREKETRVNRS
jgi:Fur family peroxide stress response transcriptional regulator